jgi:hypothetical protein
MKTLDQQYIEKQANKILEQEKTTEMQFLQRAVPVCIDWLMKQQPDYWKNYGMYWFNFRDVLENHDPKKFREFLTYVGADNLEKDDEIKKEFDYGKDIYNWTAAQLYLEQRINTYQIGADNPHEYFDENEEIKYYDPSVGFLTKEDISENV